MFNKRPDNSSIGTVKKNSNPDTMTNAEILQAIEIMMDAPEEEMNTDRIEEYLSILQSRTPVTEEYDSEVQWAKLEEAHPLAFEDSSQLEEMTPSFSARKEELHHVRHIHMLTRGAGVAAAVIVLSTVTANALGFHPIHAILQWAEGIVQVCINPSGTMELPDNTPSEYHSLTEALKCNGNVARNDLEKAGLNFQNHILFSAQDIEETVALMCYIQLSLLGVAGFVKVGNSLTDPIRNGDSLENYWFTPMYFSDVWHTRRVVSQMMDILREERESDDH